MGNLKPIYMSKNKRLLLEGRLFPAKQSFLKTF